MALFATSLAIAGCTPIPTPDVTRLIEPEPARIHAAGPPDAQPGSCYGKQVEPALIETVTEQIIVQPAELASDGRVLRPASFKTETQQRIVRERRELWFETPCMAETDPDFIASLQRALTARGFYGGPISGTYDARTRLAVRLFQRTEGLNSGILSLAAARKLGLVAVDRASTQ